MAWHFQLSPCGRDVSVIGSSAEAASSPAYQQPEPRWLSNALDLILGKLT